MMFHELLSEVIFNNIFPYLQLNDLLRLRRVSKFIKPLAEDYIRLHVTTERYISFKSPDKKLKENTDDNLAEFLSLNLPIPCSRFDISNRNNKTWEHKQWDAFVSVYGNKITHLKMDTMEIPLVSRKAIRFFESLPNLEYLCISQVDIRGHYSKKRGKYRNAHNSQNWSEEFPLPSTFRRLKSLEIFTYYCRANILSVQLVWKFISECSSNLEYIRHPFIECMHLEEVQIPGGIFGTVTRLLEGRQQESRLKYYDLREIWENDRHFANAEGFYQLVTACAKQNVKLQNVDANLIEGMMQLETWDMEDHGNKLSKVIESLHFLHKNSFLLELPHLEKIFISEEHGTAVNCSMPHWEFGRPEWSNLKDLTIWIDSEELAGQRGDDDSMIVASSELLKFFFVGIERVKIEKLELIFLLSYLNKEDILPYPKIRDVCSACPNLRKLTISYWPGSNKAISMLWDNLPLLEDVKFENCKNLGNVAFVGEDKDNPSFLKMTNLKSLELEYLDNMPKITDTLFTLVLRHMPLKELYLRNRIAPLKSITTKGLKSLLTGIFANNIEKFRLVNCVKLENVTDVELAALEKEFRSSQML